MEKPRVLDDVLISGPQFWVNIQHRSYKALKVIRQYWRTILLELSEEGSLV